MTAPACERPVLDALHEKRAEISLPALEPGEHYRFHFDMRTCIGCRCCEVACNEQNGNPDDVRWRRVGEVEIGLFPNARRRFVSMSCNHCLQPSCMIGCPTDAYSKRADGIVVHDADRCIGCQYCTWTCPYGVPQLDPTRNVVTKCHMCVDRIDAGQNPACVSACPTQSIQLEAVKPERWRLRAVDSDAPGVPPSALTLSTTRISQPATDAGEPRRAEPLAPEHGHSSLVAFLTGSQVSVGAAAAALVLGSRLIAAVACALAMLSMVGATLHLGRPLYAITALRAWRRSWLSREVLVFGGYVGALAGAVALDAAPLLALAVALGVAGVVCSAAIYLLPARPAWDTWRTPAQFAGTAALGGAATLALVEPRAGVALAVAAAAQAALAWAGLAAGAREDAGPLRDATRLLAGPFARSFAVRLGALACVAALGIARLVAPDAPWQPAAIAAALVVVAELIGRHLFFRAVVPLHAPGSFFSR